MDGLGLGWVGLLFEEHACCAVAAVFVVALAAALTTTHPPPPNPQSCFPDGRLLLSLLGSPAHDPLATSQLVGGRYPPYSTAHFCLGGTVQVAMPADYLAPPDLLRAVRRFADDLYRDLESQPARDAATNQPIPPPPSRDVEDVFVEIEPWGEDGGWGGGGGGEGAGGAAFDPYGLPGAAGAEGGGGGGGSGGGAGGGFFNEPWSFLRRGVGERLAAATNVSGHVCAGGRGGFGC